MIAYGILFIEGGGASTLITKRRYQWHGGVFDMLKDHMHSGGRIRHRGFEFDVRMGDNYVAVLVYPKVTNPLITEGGEVRPILFDKMQQFDAVLCSFALRELLAQYHIDPEWAACPIGWMESEETCE